MSKFFIGWTTGYLTVLIMDISGFGGMRVSELGWLCIPLGVANIALFLGMKWVASKWASDRDSKDLDKSR